MKKSQIAKLIAFPLLLGAAIASMDIFLFRPIDDNLTAYGSFYSQIEDSLDFVVVGNSTVREGYIPTKMRKEFKITSRTFSSSPTHPEVIKTAIEGIEAAQSPKVMYIDLNGLTYQKRANAEFFIKQYYNSLPEGNHKKEVLNEYSYLNETKESGYELFQNHNNFRQQQYWESLIYPQQFQTKGYFPNQIIQKVNPLEFSLTETLELPEDGKYYYEKIINECEKYKEQTKFIFGKLPRFNSTKEDVEGSYMLRSLKNDIQNRGFEFIDFSELTKEINLNPNKDQKDVEHLNHLGALKFTKYFGEYLKNNYGLKNLNHSNEVISDFEKSLSDTENYLNSIEEKMSK